jgi:hypothetical protein
MTTPDERYRSLVLALLLVRELARGERLHPDELEARARLIHRHAPGPYDLRRGMLPDEAALTWMEKEIGL